MQRRALFVVSVSQFSRESYPLLTGLRDEGFDVHVVVGWSGVSADEYAARCRDAGFSIHRPPPKLRYADDRFPAGPRASESPAPTGPIHTIKRRIGFAYDDTRVIVRALLRFAAIKRFASTLFAQVEPDVVLAGPFHSCGWFDEGIAALASRRKLPYVCYSVRPYLGERYVVSTRLSDADQFRLSAHLAADKGRLNRLLARVFPSWTRSRGDRAFFPFDARMMLAAKLSGLLAANPWQAPSELFDLCLVESDLARDLLIESAYDPKKIAVTGKPVLDAVLERATDPGREREVRTQLGLAGDGGFVLCNLEPSAEHSYITWDEQWRRIRALMSSLAETGLPIVISLHPLCERVKYEFIETEFGFHIARDHSMIELLPYCSIVVSYPSSLNPTAVLLRAPLVMYDFLGSTRSDQPVADIYRLPGVPIAYAAADVGPLVAEVARATSFGRRSPVDASASATRRSIDAVIERFGLADA